MNEHYCITCKKNLDIDNFYFNKTKNKLYNKCKLCIKQNKKIMLVTSIFKSLDARPNGWVSK